MPQRNNIQVALFDIVFDHIALWCLLNLFETFLLAAYFKIIWPNFEIGKFGAAHIVGNARLVQKKGLADRTQVGLFARKCIAQVGIV